jgi:hypothetical protein
MAEGRSPTCRATSEIDSGAIYPDYKAPSSKKVLAFKSTLSCTIEPEVKQMRGLFLALIIGGAGAFLAALGGAQTTKHESAFACDRLALTPEARKRHFDELSPALRAIKKNLRELPNGFEFEFPADPASFRLVSEWAAGEHLCCPFFDIDLRLEREGGAFWLRLTGREGVKQFIKGDFAPWFPGQ